MIQLKGKKIRIDILMKEKSAHSRNSMVTMKTQVTPFIKHMRRIRKLDLDLDLPKKPDQPIAKRSQDLRNNRELENRKKEKVIIIREGSAMKREI